jgi:hypothetical protein
MTQADVLVYCTGLIFVCTVLLVIATAVTIQNFQLLRRLTEDSVGAHDEPPVRDTRAGRERRPVERYDSNDSFDDGAPEWTGPVTTYTPSNRPS